MCTGLFGLAAGILAAILFVAGSFYCWYRVLKPQMAPAGDASSITKTGGKSDDR